MTRQPSPSPRARVWGGFWAAASVAAAAATPLPAAPATSGEARRAEIDRELAGLPLLVADSQSHERVGFHGYRRDPAWIRIDFGGRIEPEKILLFPAKTRPEGPTGFPASLEIEIAGEESFAEAVRLARWQEAAPGAGERLPFLAFEGNGAAGRYLRLLVTGFRAEPTAGGEEFYRLGEIVVLAGGRNAALRRPVTTTAAFESSRRWEPMNLTDGFFWCLPLRGRQPAATNGFTTSSSPGRDAGGNVWVEVDLGASRPIDEIHLVPAHPRGGADLPGYGFPTHFRILADAATPTEQLVCDESNGLFPGEPLPNPGQATFMIATPRLVARTIRVACDGLFRAGPGSGQGPNEHLFALAELQCWQGGKNLAVDASVRSSGAMTGAGWSPAALVDGFSSRHDLLGWTAWLSGLERRAALEAEASELDARTAAARDRRQQRLLAIAVAATSVSILAAAAAVVVQRARQRGAQEAFRRRLARDLHDEIGASLSHLAMQSDLAREQLARDDRPDARLAGLSASARATLDDMRDVIWLLTPRTGTWVELAHRLESIARRMLDGIGHDVVVHGRPPEGLAANDGAREVVGFLKEALANALRHANATRLRVVFEWGDRLVIRVEDNGRGFDMPAVAREEDHYGLGNLARRAAALGGISAVESAPGRGTRVRLVAPLKRGAGSG
jgi:signal transduction histidine kinase